MIAMKKLPGLATLSLLATLTCNLPANAAEELTINTDQSQVITVDRPPGTIVVGNPTIADVTLQGNFVIVHGRVFGKTNIIVLDENGNQLGNYAINVVSDDDYEVVIFKSAVLGSVRETYTCKTNCESVFHVGDGLDYYKLIAEQQKGKLGMAQGQKPGESGDATGGQAPPAQ